MKPVKNRRTQRDYAELYGVDLTRIKRLVTAGVDLTKPDEIAALTDSRDLEGDLAEYRRQKDLAPVPVANESEDLSLEASVARLREAEAILYQEFKQASRAERPRAQKSWLSMQAARLKAEIEIHEAAKLSSESLPVDEVKTLWATALQTYRSEIEAIPSKWAIFLFEKPQWKVEEELKRLTAELIAKHLSCLG